MRLIDADALKVYFTENFTEVWHYTGVRAVIDIAPTIDAEPVRHGHWENGETCSVCGCGIMEYCYELPISEFPRCPFCGAIIYEVNE